MNTITALKTIDVLRQIFAQFGVVKQIISDNGRTFTSAEFQNFVKNNGIIHKTSAPWHPATQGLVERFVQTFKQAMKSALTDGGSLNQKITCFLLQYRNAVHATTNESPAKLLLGRQLRSRLDLIKPNTRDTVEKKQFEAFAEPKRSQFPEGERVMVRDYRENTINGRTLKLLRNPDRFHTRLPLEIREHGADMQIRWFEHRLNLHDRRRTHQTLIWI